MAELSLRVIVVSDSKRRGVLARLRIAAKELIEDARIAFRRAKKGLEPIDKVQEKPLSVPTEVVMGQYGPAIIARKDRD